jgi:UPF0716 protein FxsA
VFLLIAIGVPVLEVFVFIEVGRAIGWLPAILLLLATSVLGTRLLQVQGRAAIERVALAVSERREPARAAIDGLLGFLGGVLLAIPGFVSDALGVLLLIPFTRRWIGRWFSRHYAGRMMRFATTTGRFASGVRRWPTADAESTAVDDDIGRLDR